MGFLPHPVHRSADLSGIETVRVIEQLWNRYILLNILSEITTFHRWARLLKQRTSINVYGLPTKENKLPSVFCFQKTNGSWLFPLSVRSKQTEFAVFN
jgi:hypothetical protein